MKWRVKVICLVEVEAETADEADEKAVYEVEDEVIFTPTDPTVTVKEVWSEGSPKLVE